MIKAGKFIKELRTKKNLSQRKFAQLTNISYRQIQRIENSQSDITLNKLNNILGNFELELKITVKEMEKKIVLIGDPDRLNNCACIV